MPAPPDAHTLVSSENALFRDMKPLFHAIFTSEFICSRKGAVSSDDVRESTASLLQEACQLVEQRRMTVPR